MRPTRFYLAARYARRGELRGYALQLEDAGVEVVAGWLTRPPEDAELAARVEASRDDMPLEAVVYSDEDKADIQRCDVLVAFSEKPYNEIPLSSRGMRHVEFGWADAWGKQIVIVGPRENVAHTQDHIERMWEWDAEALLELTGRERSRDWLAEPPGKHERGR